MTRTSELRDEIKRRLEQDDYCGAEALAAKGVEQFGSRTAKAFYPLLWERAMSRGDDALRERYLIAQSSADIENVSGEALRHFQLAFARKSPPVAAKDLPKRPLATLSKSPQLKNSWRQWKRAIVRLQNYLTDGPLPPKGNQNPGAVTAVKPMILTAGSGRSGSSAVFDWVNGFGEFCGTRDQCFYLRDFVATLKYPNNSAAYRRRLVETLWRTFLGRYVFETKAAYRKASLARRLIKLHGSETIASACNDVIEALTEATATESNSASADFSRLPSLLSAVSRVFAEPGKRFAATGWLDFDGASAYRYLTNSYVVCSIRDPRDVYAEHLLLTRTFNKDVGLFIEDYLARMTDLEMAIGASCPSNVFVVRFEEFVLSERVRSDLASKLQIDESLPQRYSIKFRFQAERSQKNVGLYKNCSEASAIRRIEADLSSYCFSP